MKIFGWLLSLFCVFIGIEIIVNAWANIKAASHLDAKDYIAYVQLLITFCTAILLAAFNFAATRSNEELKARLARESAAALADLQKSLNVETAAAVEKIRAEFNASVNESTERLRAQLSQSSEDFKARLGQVIPQRYNGYHSMFKAATKYFFALRTLEKGIYPSDDLQEAVKSADEAVGSALIVDQEDRELFFDFIREALVIQDVARGDQHVEKLKDVWEREGKQFGKHYNDLEREFAAKVQS
jgi:hypothetical protein